MQQHLKAYGIFIAFLLVTKIIVKPVVDKLNLPLIGTNL